MVRDGVMGTRFSNFWGSRGRFSEFLPLDSHGLKCFKICGHPDPHLWTPRHRWRRTSSYQRMRWVNLRTLKTMRRMSHRGPWARFKRVWETQWEVREVWWVACLLLCFKRQWFRTKYTKLMEIGDQRWSKCIKRPPVRWLYTFFRGPADGIIFGVEVAQYWRCHGAMGEKSRMEEDNLCTMGIPSVVYSTSQELLNFSFFPSMTWMALMKVSRWYCTRPCVGGLGAEEMTHAPSLVEFKHVATSCDIHQFCPYANAFKALHPNSKHIKHYQKTVSIIPCAKVLTRYHDMIKLKCRGCVCYLAVRPHHPIHPDKIFWKNIDTIIPFDTVPFDHCTNRIE